MYVDKILSGIKAVQTLSRLNRAHPQKHDVFVLDFMNDSNTIQEAFADYYRTTILAEETDPNKLHDLKGALDGYQVYTTAQIDELVSLYLNGADRDRLDPILDACVAVYREHLDENGQVDFKGKAKAFTRTYGFLSQVLPYTNAEWEKLSIFLTFLVPKLPAPIEEDLSRGILEAIDMDSYRVEKQAAVRIQLPDADAEIEPVPTYGSGRKPESELDHLSNILKTFNDQFGNIQWTDADRVRRLITEEIPARVSADTAYQNAKKNSDRQNARIEHDKALARVIVGLMKDDTELFKQFSDNDSFRKWLTDTVFTATYEVGIKTSSSLLDPSIVRQAELLVTRQFGIDAKWQEINEAIWHFFAAHPRQRLGLPDIIKMAESSKLNVEDVFSVLTLLSGPDNEFLSRVYYRPADSGESDRVLAKEVVEHTHRWWLEKNLNEKEWQDWASGVFVGWEPTVMTSTRAV